MGSKQIQSNSLAPPLRSSVHILAIMVEFQTDDVEQTTGNGKFQSDSTAVSQIDPPPHDSLYFKNKILFVENYFRKVSNDILSVTGDVFSDYKNITLSKPMTDYSPPTNTIDNKKLAELARESWQKADSIYPEIDFSKYDAFVIFHAGAGRDVDLVSSLGYNPTPHDIPSLYLDSAAFASALDSASFHGIAVGSGNRSALIKTTIILPETESHVLSTTLGNDTLQLSINGMFAASIGSYLGLPDLFDTKTGRSGIGQFGLMDGAGIFAYNGLFPPEPSAWEKIWLGWVSPITIRSTSANLQVPAVGLTNTGQDTIYKILISESEYYLVENRNRNPKGILDINIAKAHGETLWRHFGQDTIGFKYYDVKGISGSVIDVSNFDWAIIGETDGTGKYDGGGILIWHIDENVIQAGLGTNSVNNDREHRGVDLEEADGSKDIGQDYAFLTTGSGTENGSPLDCWFYGNVAVLYKNIFDRSSYPNSNSHSGATSLVTINNFSERAPRMTATVEIGNQILKRDFILSSRFSEANGYPNISENHLYLPTSKGVFEIFTDGLNLIKDTMGIFPAATKISEVAVCRWPAIEVMAGVQDSTLYVFRIDSPSVSLPFFRTKVGSLTIGEKFTTSPCFAKLDSLFSIIAGTDAGTIYQFDTSGTIIRTRSSGTGPVSSITLLPGTILSKPEEYFFTSGNRLYSEQPHCCRLACLIK